MTVRRAKATSRVTINDVAAAAGVSRGTVSRVVNGEGYVSSHAIKAVKDAIQATGYFPNLAARMLASRSSRTAAVIVDRAAVRLSGDSNTTAMILAFQSMLAEYGYRSTSLLLGATANDDETAAAFIRDGSVDGVYLLSDETCPQILAALAETSVPAVVSCMSGGGNKHTTISIDDERAAFDISTLLVKARRLRPGMIAVELDKQYGQARLRGFTTAVGHAFRPDLVIEATDCTFEAGRQAATELLRKHPDIDGIFVASDAVAAGSMLALHELGRRVPEHIGVVGFDGNEWSKRCEPHLTTVRQPSTELGQAAALALLTLIAGVETESVVIPGELLLRQSV